MRSKMLKALSLILCVSMLLPVMGALNVEAAFIPDKAFSDYTLQEYQNLTAQEQKEFFNSFPSLKAFNQWYNAAKKAADEEKLVIGDNSIDLGNLLNAAVLIGSSPYASLEKAFASAQPGDTVVLNKDVSQSSVTVPDGVALDLSGKTLTADSFGFIPNSTGKIIDSSQENTGLLKIPAENASFLSVDAFGENTIPVYDSENEGYRFCQYTYGQEQVYTDTNVSGAAKFWFKLQLGTAAAYEMVYAGGSGVKLGVDISYTGEENAASFLFKKDGSEEAWIQSYAGFVLGYDDGQPSQDPWLWVRVQNAASVDTLTLTPYVTAGGVDIYLTPIQYRAQ